MTSFYNLLKYAATGQASPDMTYYDKMRASTLMGGATIQTLTGQPPISFKADGTPLISWSMKGNGSQTGTPTPDNPVMPEFVGTLDDSDWTVPITCAGQTVPVYLGQTQTVRRVRKLVLTGEETFVRSGSGDSAFYRVVLSDMARTDSLDNSLCNYFAYTTISSSNTDIGFFILSDGSSLRIRPNDVSSSTLQTFTTWLAQKYAAGHPVTVWYVLATEQTAIVNEPLCKIGDYADELSSEDAGVSIPTVKWQNTLTVETELQPCEMTITYKG